MSTVKSLTARVPRNVWWLALVALPFVLAACTNGSGGGDTGY
jgi:hypothetical protein